MAFTGNAKVLLLCGLATLLLTWTVFHETSPHGYSDSLQGRKSLQDSQVNERAPGFGGDLVDSSEDVTEEEEAAEEVVEEVSEEPEDAARTEFSTEPQEDSEELRFGQGRAVRAMEETSGDGDVDPDLILPEPEYEPDSFEARILAHNKLAAAKEKAIHACEVAEGCGTVE